MSKILIKSGRLGLRPHSIEDVDFMIRLNSDPEVIRFTGDSSFNNTDEAKRVVLSLIQQYEAKRIGRFVVIDLLTGEKLGWCGLKWHDDKQVSDLGYRFFRHHWGKGYASEASRACLQYGFEELNYSRVIAHADLENIASVRVLEKLGFINLDLVTNEGFYTFELTRESYNNKNL
jgi:[ribosomal protein S5]-alanine N-acetyltransferase